MEQYQGKSVFGGVAIGRIHVFSKGQQQVKRIKVQDTEAEKKLLSRGGSDSNYGIAGVV